MRILVIALLLTSCGQPTEQALIDAECATAMNKFKTDLTAKMEAAVGQVVDVIDPDFAEYPYVRGCRYMDNMIIHHIMHTSAGGWAGPKRTCGAVALYFPSDTRIVTSVKLFTIDGGNNE